MDSGSDSLKDRVARHGEETIGKLAQDLLQHPVVHGTISAVFGARERASRVQEVAMGSLNLPSANDLARLTRRLRSVSQRLEGLEDGLDRVVERLDQLHASPDLGARLESIEQLLQRLQRSLGVTAPGPGADTGWGPGGDAPPGSTDPPPPS